MLHSEKHLLGGKVQRQVYVEAHHEEVQDCELRGQGSFEWTTDLIETKKLENYTCQVAQDLYTGEAQHELRGVTADLFTKHRNGLRTLSLARELGLRILEGTNGDD